MIVFLLLTFLKILVAVLVMLWVTIAVSLIYRNRRTRHLQLLENTFADIISRYLYPLPNDEFDLIKAQRTFRKVGIVPSKPNNVQYLIDLMIRTQRTLLGSNYYKLEVLYKQIPPYRVSVNKLNSKKWYVKAKGIREIYEMDQEQYLPEIIRERNNKNIYVRREAQIAMVVFLGWNSLRFLPYLNRRMTLWQQIKIVEKLHYLYPQPEIGILRKAYDSEKQYATELIMRIIRKFNLKEEVHYILRFLDSPIFDTRETAIYCISSFDLAEEQLAEVKLKFLDIPNTEQQVQLLKYIERISPEVDLKFYKILLYTGNDIIKLSTAEILWNRGYIPEVQEFYYQQYTTQPETIKTLI